MFLQGDKPSATLTRDRASRVLFDGEDASMTQTQTADTFVNFAYDHNITGFKELVQEKYSDKVEEKSYTPTSTPSSTPSFSQYYTVETPYEATATPTQKYYNDTNPIPYQSFRPKVLTDFEDLQIDRTARNELDEALLQKIDEVQILDHYENVESPSKATITTDVVRESSETEAVLKLNAKGLIACVTFIAVTLLIVLLVIMNSIAIGSSNTQIKRLRDENTQLQQQYSDAENLRAQAFAKGEQDAYAFAESEGAITPDRETLPPISSYQLNPANPDASTNLFDIIAKFLNSIFR